MDINEKYMQQALNLARLGSRAVAPNPMVGAVIIKDGRVIGEGYHKKFGGPHAEVNAIRSIKNKKDLVGAVMYVTLEPCRHYGKTPPCSLLIEQVGIKRVVCGSRDSFLSNYELRIKNYELRFLQGKVADQCHELNKFFFMWVEKKRPFITVKIAVSADGFVAGLDGKPVRITSNKQDVEVHKLRAQYQAIMIGSNTVINDDPLLTVRYIKGKDPLRVILDSQLRIPMDVNVLNDRNVLVATTRTPEGVQSIARLRGRGVNIWVSPTKKRVSLKKLFTYLAKQGISSVLVEPGPTLYQSFKKAGLIDELIILNGKRDIREGLKIDL